MTLCSSVHARAVADARVSTPGFWLDRTLEAAERSDDPNRAAEVVSYLLGQVGMSEDRAAVDRAIATLLRVAPKHDGRTPERFGLVVVSALLGQGRVDEAAAMCRKEGWALPTPLRAALIERAVAASDVAGAIRLIDEARDPAHRSPFQSSGAEQRYLAALCDALVEHTADPLQERQRLRAAYGDRYPELFERLLVAKARSGGLDDLSRIAEAEPAEPAAQREAFRASAAAAIALAAPLDEVDRRLSVIPSAEARRTGLQRAALIAVSDGDTDRAIELLERFPHPDPAEARRNVGAVSEALRWRNDLEGHFRLATTLLPDPGGANPALYEWPIELARRGERAEAQRLLNSVYPGTLDALDSAHEARVLCTLDRHDDARTLATAKPGAWYALYQEQVKQRQWQEAIRTLEVTPDLRDSELTIELIDGVAEAGRRDWLSRIAAVLPRTIAKMPPHLNDHRTWSEAALALVNWRLGDRTALNRLATPAGGRDPGPGFTVWAQHVEPARAWERYQTLDADTQMVLGVLMAIRLDGGDE